MGVLGLILGLLAAVCGFIATFLFGNAGGIVAGVLAIAAVVLGILKRKRDKKGGIAAIVIGVLAALLAFVMAGLWSLTFSELHKKAKDYKPDGLWATVTEDTSGGLIGILSQLPSDQASIDALMEEMNELNKLDQ